MLWSRSYQPPFALHLFSEDYSQHSDWVYCHSFVSIFSLSPNLCTLFTPLRRYGWTCRVLFLIPQLPSDTSLLPEVLGPTQSLLSSMIVISACFGSVTVLCSPGWLQTQYTVEANLELLILLLTSFECQDERCEPPHPACNCHFIHSWKGRIKVRNTKTNVNNQREDCG